VDFKNFIRSWTTVNYSILWVKFSALRRGFFIPLRSFSFNSKKRDVFICSFSLLYP
jgi:hypothetical protein